MSEFYKCTRCGISKPFNEMSKRSSRKNGLHGWCKLCMNERKRERKTTEEQRKQWGYKTRYGLSIEQIESMKLKQNFLCAICSGEMKRMVVDHDHKTGAVRGLLCHPCNIKLHALDNWKHKAEAETYLLRCRQ